MTALIFTLAASAATGATAGLWVLGIWWRFALSLALSGALWALALAKILGN